MCSLFQELRDYPTDLQPLGLPFISLEIASEVGLEKTKEIRSPCQSCFDEPRSEIVSLAEKCLESSTFPISEDYGQLV